jgi:glycosyltransferase involved in cell wall biosynthesis
MIVLCEPVCWGTEHVSFNAGVLETILVAFPQEKLFFYGERVHIELIQSQIGSALASKVVWVPIALPDRKAEYFRRLLCEIKIIKGLLPVLYQKSKIHLLFLTVTHSTFLALRLCKHLLPTGLAVQVALHGGLSELVQNRSRHPVRRLKDINTAITVIGRRNFQYLVLEENIRELLLKKFPFLSGSVEVLAHPLSPNEGDENDADLVRPIRFGFLGMASEEKGFPRFVALAAEIVRKYGDRVEFHALGVCPNGEPLITGMSALDTQPVPEHLSREMFVAHLRKLHFTVFPYKPEHYGLSPSGTLLDAIAWRKPVIAARIPLFENLFNRYGNIGYLFGSEFELREIVEDLVERPDASLYRSQVLNLCKAREDRTPAALAPAYRAICKRARSHRMGPRHEAHEDDKGLVY